MEISTIDFKPHFYTFPSKKLYTSNVHYFYRQISCLISSSWISVWFASSCAWMAKSTGLYNQMFGFLQLKSDVCADKYSTNISCQILGVLVDDILCLETTCNIIHWFKEKSSSHFSITIKSSVDSFLGMKVSHNRLSLDTISLSQPGYIVNLMLF